MDDQQVISSAAELYDAGMRALVWLCAGLTCALLVVSHRLYFLSWACRASAGSCCPARPAIFKNTMGILPNISQYFVYHPGGHGRSFCRWG